MTLASIEIKTEHDDLLQYFTTYAMQSNEDKIFIGVTNFGITDEKWFTLKDDKYLPYIPSFFPGNPSNSGGNEHCLEVIKHPSGTLVNDISCDATRKFVCEAENP